MLDNNDTQEAIDLELQPQPLVDWQNPPTVADLKGDMTEAETSADRHRQRISGWLDNLHVLGAAKVKARKGRSQHVPRLIRKQAEWRYAALSEPFLSTRNLFKAEPVTWEDSKAAQQNELVLNYQFNHKIKKRKFIDDYVRTATNEGTTIVKVCWDFEEEEIEEEVPVYQYFDSPTIRPILEQAIAYRESNPNGFYRDVPPEVQESLIRSEEAGTPIEAVPTGETRTQITTKTVRNQPDLEVCDYRRITIDPTCKGDMDKCRFIIHEFESSLDELHRDGRYKNLDKLGDAGKDVLAMADYGDEDGTFDFKDKPRKQITVREYWGYWDIHGTGKVLPIVAAWVDGTFIRLEENPYPHKRLPFVIVQYLPVVGNSYGEPDGHLLEDNQKILGALTRGMIDSMARSANGQMGIRKDVLDATNRRKFERGMDYEFNTQVDPRQGIYMHTYPEIPASAQFMYQLQNMEAESLTGVKAFSGGLTGDALGESVGNGRSVLDAASKREAGILRRLADGVTEIGRMVLSMNAEFLDDEEVVRVTNEQFVTVRRDDLAGRFDIHLTISTAEEDNAKAQELAFMLQTMGNNMDHGMVTTIMTEIARLRKMPELAKKIETYEPQPDPLAVEEQQLKIEKLKAEIAHLGGRTQESYAGAELDIAKAREASSNADLKDLDFVEQEAGVKQERELQLHGAQAEANMRLESHKAALTMESDQVKDLREYVKKKSSEK